MRQWGVFLSETPLGPVGYRHSGIGIGDHRYLR